MQKYVFHYYKLWEKKLVLIIITTETDDPKLPRKRKVWSCYEEGEAPVEFVHTVEEHYHQILYHAIDMLVNCIRDKFQQKYYIENSQTMEILILKDLHEEGFGYEK